MNINQSNNFIIAPNSTSEKTQIDYKASFSKALENLKNNKPADYDEEAFQDQKTTTMT